MDSLLNKWKHLFLSLSVLNHVPLLTLKVWKDTVNKAAAGDIIDFTDVQSVEYLKTETKSL